MNRPVTDNPQTDRRRPLDVRLLVVCVAATVLGLSLPYHRDFARMAIAFGTLVLASVAGLAIAERLALFRSTRPWLGALWVAGLVIVLAVVGFGVMIRLPMTARRLPALGAALPSLLFSCLALLMLGRVGQGAATPDRAIRNQWPRRFVSVRTKVGSLSTGVAVWSSAVVIAMSGLAERAIEPWVVVSGTYWLAGAAALVYGSWRVAENESSRESWHASDWMIRGILMMHFGEAIAFLPPISWPTTLIWLLFEVARWSAVRRQMVLANPGGAITSSEVQP